MTELKPLCCPAFIVVAAFTLAYTAAWVLGRIRTLGDEDAKRIWREQ